MAHDCGLEGIPAGSMRKLASPLYAALARAADAALPYTADWLPDLPASLIGRYEAEISEIEALARDALPFHGSEAAIEARMTHSRIRNDEIGGLLRLRSPVADEYISHRAELDRAREADEERRHREAAHAKKQEEKNAWMRPYLAGNGKTESAAGTRPRELSDLHS